MKSKDTWIIVADGAQARIFRNSGPGKGLDPVQSEQFSSENRASRDIDADRPGRRQGGLSRSGHATAAQTDAHRHEEHEFVRKIANAVEAGRLRKDFERLVLVAAPRALGDLRTFLSKPCRAMVYGELAKDLTNADARDLPMHLKNIMVT